MRSRTIGPATNRLLTGVAVAVAGWGFASLTSADVSGHPAYLYAVTALLSIGLYGSAYGISRESVTGHVRTVVLAVTVGVLLKTAIIAAVMYLFFGEPVALLLGLAVAQIDPLSVSALMGGSRMSPKAKSLLLAWASFDDPITALLTIYLTSLVLGDVGSAGVGGYVANLGLNLLFAGIVLAGWLLARRLRTRVRPGLLRLGAVLVLVGLLAVATAWFLVLGIALIGLFYRPALGALLDRAITVAFYLATFALGLLLVGGVEPVPALVLGVAAFGAQMLVGGLLITRGLPVRDRVGLALGQQNGITAILLALTLARSYPSAVAVIAPAVLVINVLHLLANAGWQKVLTSGPSAEPLPAPAGPVRRAHARVLRATGTAPPAQERSRGPAH